jgi:hypothetical protein
MKSTQLADCSLFVDLDRRELGKCIISVGLRRRRRNCFLLLVTDAGPKLWLPVFARGRVNNGGDRRSRSNSPWSVRPRDGGPLSGTRDLQYPIPGTSNHPRTYSTLPLFVFPMKDSKTIRSQGSIDILWGRHIVESPTPEPFHLNRLEEKGFLRSCLANYHVMLLSLNSSAASEDHLQRGVPCARTLIG